MAAKPLCSVEGCGKPHYARGYCRNHYHRLRTHGDPLAGKAAQGEPLEWIKRHADYADDGCLVWPFARFANGYGMACNTNASNVMCREAHGPAPLDQPFALHSCGNGQGGCVSPQHLRWGTQEENMLDSVAEGTRSRGEDQHASKLTEAAVLDIRSSSDRPGVLAAKYGVHPDTVTRVRKRQAWAWLE